MWVIKLRHLGQALSQQWRPCSPRHVAGIWVCHLQGTLLWSSSSKVSPCNAAAKEQISSIHLQLLVRSLVSSSKSHRWPMSTSNRVSNAVLQTCNKRRNITWESHASVALGCDIHVITVLLECAQGLCGHRCWLINCPCQWAPCILVSCTALNSAASERRGL